MLVLLRLCYHSLKLTSPMGDQKKKKKPCALFDFAYFLGPETGY